MSVRNCGTTAGKTNGSRSLHKFFDSPKENSLQVMFAIFATLLDMCHVFTAGFRQLLNSATIVQSVVVPWSKSKIR